MTVDSRRARRVVSGAGAPGTADYYPSAVCRWTDGNGSPRAYREPRMSTPDVHMESGRSTPHPANAFSGFDASVERTLGADMRLVYGMAVPILMVVGLIIILALSPAVWLVAAILVLELALLGVVVYGFVGMLNDDDDMNAG